MVVATILITTLALTAVWGSAFYWLSVNRSERVGATRDVLGRLSKTIDEHVDGQLRTGSVFLRTVEAWLALHPTADLRDDADFLTLARNFGVARPGFAELILLTADGTSFAPTDDPSQTAANFADAEFFTAGAALPPGRIYLGEAIKTAQSGRTLLPLVLRLPPRPDGFVLVATAIDIDELADVFDKARPPPSGVIAMYRTDGKLLLGTPVAGVRGADAIDRATLFGRALPGAPSGSFEDAFGLLPGNARMVNYRSLPDFPVVIAVSVALRDVLDAWRSEMTFSVAVAALLSATFIVLAWWLVRLLSDSQAQATELAESRRVLIKAQTLAQLGSFRRNIGTGDLIWSAEACRILGYSPGMAPRSLTDFMALVHPDDRSAIGDGLRLIESGRSYASDFRIFDAHGEIRYLHAMGSPEFDSAGAPIAVDGIVQDITERKQLEQALRDARDAAERGSRAKSEFLANMSHELRTPLNAVIGFSEIMRTEILGPVANPKYREYLDDIHKSAQHLLLIINDILDIARIEAGRVELKEARIDLRRMADECARMLHGRAADAGLHLETAFEDGAPWCIGDERLLRQVLLNLASNAIKFTPAGGRVRIQVGRKVGGELTLAVRDTGIGMTAEEAAVALRPFGQVQSAFARSRDGVGLGLPLAKSFVELHGGMLLLETAPGRGTTVMVNLPSWRAVHELA